jgi:hypothetical protein
MASVLIVYTLRHVLSAYMLKIYALTAAALALVFTVSLPHIAENMMQVGLAGTGSFIVSAVLSTTVSVQIMSAVAVCMGALLVRDSLRVGTSATFN